ncbi:MAG: AMP-binding protein, partial [Bacillota bacterium]
MRAPLSPLVFFQRAVRIFGDRTAVIDGDVRLTYREFAARCERLARGLRGLGIDPGDRVAVLSPNTHRALECYYAVPLAGGVLVPLNTRLGPSDYRYILSHSGAKAILADPTFADLAVSLRQVLPSLQLVLLSGETAAARNAGRGEEVLYSEDLTERQRLSGDGVFRQGLIDVDELDEEALITLNYTSGTTANPKGVMLTHRNTALNVLDFIIHGRLTVNDIYLHTLPMFHVNGWGGVWAVTAVGATHVCLPKIDPAHIVHLIDSLGVTMACSAPTVLVMLGSDPATANWRPKHAVRWYVGGAPPPAALIRRMEHELGFEIVHVYGLTETSPWLTVCEWRDEWNSLSPEERARIKARQGIGQILTGEVRVVRPDLTDVAPDGHEVGEIVVRGPTVMKGYYKDPEATAEA